MFGPGSLLTSSKVGASYQYDLIWLLAATAVLMATYTAMAARIGVVADGTPCQIVARRVGRPFAALLGLTVCLICGAFQFSNNLAVAAAAETLTGSARWGGAGVLVAINIASIVFLFAFKELYRWVERLMMLMVGLMFIAFALNLLVVRPEIGRVVAGLLPSLPDRLHFDWPSKVNGSVADPLVLLAGLIGTTFSVAAAFYQGTLVREKGWRMPEYRRGIVDAIAGIAVLAVISAMIMTTAGTVLTKEPMHLGELAGQLDPTFGPAAYVLFCVGMLAAALSSFLLNAMIGGTLLADGVGLPAKMSDGGPRAFTVGVLLVGMGVGLWALKHGSPVELIIFAQAITVLGNPLMAATILWLANRRDVMGDKRNTLWLNVLGVIGLAVVLMLAARLAFTLYLKLS